ncbi:hypothetical protein RSAG8_03695, partial [Rhizoctonia solani AG-8 WAC10335]
MRGFSRLDSKAACSILGSSVVCSFRRFLSYSGTTSRTHAYSHLGSVLALCDRNKVTRSRTKWCMSHELPCGYAYFLF